MIRGLLITTAVSFVIAIVCLAGADVLGGAHFSGRSWSLDNGCTWSADGKTKTCTGLSARVDGRTEDGPDKTRDYAWTGGDALTINAPAEVRFTQGEGSKVTITGPQSVLDRITLQDGEIDLDGRRRKIERLLITVEAPNVTAFRFNGGQKIHIAGYAQDTLKIETNGAVDLHATGTARIIDLRMNGASNADLNAVINEDARIELNGASNVSIKPKSSVDIRINGVGNVSLGSNPPRVTKEIHGLGGVSVETDEATGSIAPPTAAPAPSLPKPPRHEPASTT